jgi:hypothetical protein
MDHQAEVDPIDTLLNHHEEQGRDLSPSWIMDHQAEVHPIDTLLSPFDLSIFSGEVGYGASSLGTFIFLP